MPSLNQVDLAFIVDTTGSMGSFISAAQAQMIDLLQGLTSDPALSIDLQVGVVEYRDHPPQEQTFVTHTHPFTGQMEAVQAIIGKLTPTGGGDMPEAVYDGVVAANRTLAWRHHSRRVAVLVGDAPPHGSRRPDDPCHCGLTAEQATAVLEGANIVLYALGLTHDVETSFGWLASLTGGRYFQAGGGGQAMEAIRHLLRAEFDDLGFDQRVLAHCQGDPAWTVDGLGTALEAPRGRISASLSRLGRRHLLDARGPALPLAL